MRWLSKLIVAFVIVLSAHPLCDGFFDCGCAPLWAGAAEHCNIHDPSKPDCPWCTGGAGRLAWVGALIAAGAFGPIAALRKRGFGVLLAAGLGGYLIAATVASLLAALIAGYPKWLLFSLPGL